MSNPIQSLKRNSLSLSVAAALGGLALVSTGAQAAAPAAGTLIKNAAVATYTENGTTTTLKSSACWKKHSSTPEKAKARAWRC